MGLSKRKEELSMKGLGCFNGGGPLFFGPGFTSMELGGMVQETRARGLSPSNFRSKKDYEEGKLEKEVTTYSYSPRGHLFTKTLENQDPGIKIRGKGVRAREISDWALENSNFAL